MAIDKQKRGTVITANVPLALAQAVFAHVKNGTHDSAGGVVRAALRLYLRLDEDDQPLPADPTTDDPRPDQDGPQEHSRRRRR